MEHGFWHDRWTEGRIGFHEDQPNPLLIRFIGRLGLKPGNTVFVPLCGKSVDITWLLAQGFAVVGIDLSPLAIAEVFTRDDLVPEITKTEGLTRYVNGPLRLYSGDVFALTAAELGPVQAVFDRAALVALPPHMRPDYAAHIGKIAGTAPHLLISFDYDQSAMSGPPFSVPGTEIEALYSERSATRLSRDAISGPLAQRTGGGAEEAWLIT